MVSIQNNLERLWEAITKTAQRSGRQAKEITLVAVTKQISVDRIMEAVQCGVKEIGENRVQEAEKKFDLVPKEIRKHLVGHLQTNKVKKAVKMFDMVQSLESLKLAQEIDKYSVERAMPVLVEVNTSDEQTKSGLAFEQTCQFLESLAGLKNIAVQGLMTIGPLTDDQTKIRESFRTLRRLFEEASRLSLPNCQMQYLSMGMSSDFEIAILEGANMIRIGTALFGPRN